jgi:hypothetical protein
MKITINIEATSDEHSYVTVLADGTKIASGGIGGEPEDNSIHRDYAWVTRAISATAKACGAEVEVARVQSTDDDEDDEQC